MTNVFEKRAGATPPGQGSDVGWIEKLVLAIRQNLSIRSASKVREARLMGLYFSDANGKRGYSLKTGFRERVQR